MPRTSPFPGMDPWAEARWAGVHHSLITELQSQLNEQLPDDLVAKVDERIYIGHLDLVSPPVRRPDLYVIEQPGGVGNGGVAVASVASPEIVRFPDEQIVEGYIEIVDAADHSRVWTAIEVLSPTNKLSADGRREYLAKRDAYHRGRVSTVEIDLLRDGEHLVAVPEDLLTGGRATPYVVCVRRGWKLHEREAELYRIALRSKLPTVAIPLRPSDADARVDLQAAFVASYARNRLAGMDYDRDPEPALSDADEQWAHERIAAWRLS